MGGESNNSGNILGNSFTPLSPLLDGTWYSKVKAFDFANNFSNFSGNGSVLVDTTAPDVEITSPTTSFVKGTIEIKGSVTDENPHHYWLVVQNSLGVTVAGPGTVNNSSSFVDQTLFNWNTNLVADGVYTIKLEARDAANNKDSGSVTTKSVTVDNTIPVLSSQTTYSGWYGSNQISSFEYTDTNGIASGNPASCTISTEGTAQTCSVTPNVCDNAGNCNIETVTSNGANIDKSAPTGNWITPLADSTISGIVHLEFSATDDGSGVSNVKLQYKRNDGVDDFHSLITDSESPYEVDWDTTTLPLDLYTLRAIATDNLGNVTQIDETVGVAAVVSNESGASSTYGTATITWTTDRPTKSRVVYDTVSHGSLGVAPNYGYAYSTGTFDSDPKTTSHTVTITGLSDGTVYYYRTISEGSPAAIGDQKSYRTLTIAGASSSSGGATGGQVQGVSTVSSSNNSLGYNLNQNQINGNEEVLGTETQNEELSTPKPSLIPEVKGTATNNWNARNIALISFGSALIILALLLLWRKSKK